MSPLFKQRDMSKRYFGDVWARHGSGGLFVETKGPKIE